MGYCSKPPRFPLVDGDMSVYSPAHEHGTGIITVAATDVTLPRLSGNTGTVELAFTVTVDSVNDAPTFIPASYSDQTVEEDSGDIVVQLDSVFTDADIDSDSNSLDDSHTYTITVIDTPSPVVPAGVLDATGLPVISEVFNSPAAGQRTVVIETTDPTISLPLEPDGAGTMDITVRASDLGMPPVGTPIVLFDEESFRVTVDAIADDSPIANPDHYDDFPELIMDEDSAAISFDAVFNDYLGDAPSLVISVGQTITDSFGADHTWRSTSRIADPDNSGNFVIEINGEVSCSYIDCQSAQTPDTIISGAGLISTNIMYRPRLNFNGVDTFTYCIKDSAPGGEDPFTPPADPRCSTITVLVNPVNDLPEPDDPIIFTMDQADDLIVLAADGLRTKVFDVDNTHMDGLGCDPLDPLCTPTPPLPDTLYFFLTSATTANGELLPPFLNDGSFTYRPAATFSGEDEFFFDVCEVPVPNVDNCIFGVQATIVIEAIEGAPSGSSEEVVEFDFDLADIPLELPVGPEANVLVVNDDSGSMGWDILTDQNSGLYYFVSGNYIYYTMKATAGSSTYVAPGEEDASNAGLWRLRNSTFNTVYYNPEVRYDPWDGLNSSEVEFPPSDPTDAQHDPLVSSPTTNLRLPQDYTGRAYYDTGEEVCEDVCVSWSWGICTAVEEVCTSGGQFQTVARR